MKHITLLLFCMSLYRHCRLRKTCGHRVIDASSETSSETSSLSFVWKDDLMTSTSDCDPALWRLSSLWGSALIESLMWLWDCWDGHLPYAGGAEESPISIEVSGVDWCSVTESAEQGQSISLSHRADRTIQDHISTWRVSMNINTRGTS